MMVTFNNPGVTGGMRSVKHICVRITEDVHPRVTVHIDAVYGIRGVRTPHLIFLCYSMHIKSPTYIHAVYVMFMRYDLRR